MDFTLLKTMSSHEERVSKVVNARVGMAAAIPLYTRNPVKFRFAQAINGIQMWRCGASEKLFRGFNRLGFCQGVDATRRNVDMFCTEAKAEIHEWKQSVENEIDGTTPGTDSQNTEEMSQGLSSQSLSCQSSQLSSSDEETTVTVVDELDIDLSQDDVSESESNTSERVTGYSITWDNIQKLARVRSSGKESSNTMMIWANSYAAANRIPPHVHPCDHKTKKAEDIPLTAFLPSHEDIALLKSHMAILVSRIIVTHLDHFKNYQDVTDWHVEHEHSYFTSQKSMLVNLGILHHNPSTVAGTIEIMTELQKVVAQAKDGNFHAVVAYGDGGAVSQMIKAKRRRECDLDAAERLEGLEPCPQEFHHRGIMLQNLINMLYDAKSVGEEGTLCHLRDSYGHRNATTNVMNSFNAVEDLIRFATEAHICYLTMKILRIDSLEDKPSGSEQYMTAEQRKMFLSSLSRDIVEQIWLSPTLDEILKVLSTGSDVQNEENSIDCDHVREYAMALTFYGMMDLVHRDVIREGNGPAIVSLWRFNMLRFWNGGHNNYFLIGHRFLAGVSGWCCEHIAHDMTHNRTVNLKGGKGRNIAMDRACEFLNAEFKEVLQHSRGQNSDGTVDRAGLIVGSTGRAIDKLYYHHMAALETEDSKRKRHNYHNDIKAFIDDFKGDELFALTEGRKHATFPSFEHTLRIKFPKKLKAKFTELNKKLDTYRESL